MLSYSLIDIENRFYLKTISNNQTNRTRRVKLLGFEVNWKEWREISWCLLVIRRFV